CRSVIALAGVRAGIVAACSSRLCPRIGAPHWMWGGTAYGSGRTWNPRAGAAPAGVEPIRLYAASASSPPYRSARYAPRFNPDAGWAAFGFRPSSDKVLVKLLDQAR